MNNTVENKAFMMPEITAADIAKAKREANSFSNRLSKAIRKVEKAFRAGEGIPSVKPVSKASIVATKVAAALKVAASYHI